VGSSADVEELVVALAAGGAGCIAIEVIGEPTAASSPH